MSNIIRIKRSTGTTGPIGLKNAELAYTEGGGTSALGVLYIGIGNNGSDNGATNTVKIGGPGAYLTTDTNQAPTGVKTFSIGTSGTLKINGGSSGNVLSTNGSGVLSWTQVPSNSFSTVRGNIGSVTASDSETLDIVGTSPIAIAVDAIDYDVNTGLGKKVRITASAASTSAAGVVELTDSIASTSTTTAATPNSVKTAYDLAAAALPKGGGTMTGTLTLAADPANPMEAATRKYVDSVATGLDIKASVRVATTAPFTTHTYNTGAGASQRGQMVGTLPSSIDGVTLNTGDRILVKNQSSAAQNGIWTVTASNIWDRATDFDSDAEVTPGAFTFVEEGTENGDTGWVLTTNGVITVGGASGTALSFSQFSGAGQIDAGDGLTKTGNTINVVGTAGRIVANADSIDLATVAQTDTDGTAGINFVQSITKDAYGRISGRVVANVRTASTEQTGIVSLTDSISSTSTTTAATPNSVKTAYDLANGALPKSGGTMTGKISLATSNTTAPVNIPSYTSGPSLGAVAGDLWNITGALKFQTATAEKTIAFTDSNISGTAANVSGIVAVANGGTGVNTFAAGRLLKGDGSNAIATATAGTDFVQPGTGTVGKVFFAASVSSGASFNIPSGVAPTTPADGDIWNAGGVLNFRVGATTKTALLNDSMLDGGSFS
jgi:hypothetical protein